MSSYSLPILATFPSVSSIATLMLIHLSTSLTTDESLFYLFKKDFTFSFSYPSALNIEKN
ncbi:hypothetical protein [Legionella sainthelensi]|uniref:hypothetical protein n=1 Tax=Legionella sainthelensi TaxID=28087 RepID=UPI0004896C02|nr:hypothetical protein [Legionella sainthelensi]